MKKTRTCDAIELPTGEVMTLGHALDTGRVTLRASPRWTKEGRETVQYNAWAGDVGWEVGATLFASRTGAPIPPKRA